MRIKMRAQTLAQRVQIVGQMIVRKLRCSRAAAAPQARRRHWSDRSAIGHRLAGLDQFVAGRDHDDARRTACTCAREAVGGNDRDFRRAEARARFKQTVRRRGNRARACEC